MLPSTLKYVSPGFPPRTPACWTVRLLVAAISPSARAEAASKLKQPAMIQSFGGLG